MTRQWLDKCLYCSPLSRGGHECILGRPHCHRPNNMAQNGFRDTGICTQYQESKECNPDGTTITEEE